MAAALFDGARPWPNYEDLRLSELNISAGPSVWSSPISTISDDGGFIFLGNGEALAVMRYPRFQFRPSQPDLLHVDFWIDGKNLLRDAGSYSYNSNPHWMRYFSGTASHNTVQFDDRDQMPRISRFLLGNWLKAERLQSLQEKNHASSFAAGYRDEQDARHHRSIRFQDAIFQVIDEVQGFAHKALLRWRLMPGGWQLERTSNGPCLSLKAECNVKLTVSADVPIARFELVEGW